MMAGRSLGQQPRGTYTRYLRTRQIDIVGASVIGFSFDAGGGTVSKDMFKKAPWNLAAPFNTLSTRVYSDCLRYDLTGTTLHLAAARRYE